MPDLTNEPLPLQARKAIRLAIATLLLKQPAINVPADVELAVDHAFFMADLLILKSGL